MRWDAEADYVGRMSAYVDTSIPQMQQAQASMDAQLRVLRRAAVRLGLYDADDFLREAMTQGRTGV